MVLVSIILVNWNGKEINDDCIKSLEAQSFKDFEIVFVDNASTDGSYEHVKKTYPEVRTFETGANLGFAGGNNYGIKRAKGDYIFMLNNDTVCDKDMLKNLVAEKDSADILGCKIYYYEPKDVFWSVASKVNRLTSKASLVGKGEKDKGQHDEKKFVDQVVGAAIFINKKVFEKIGYLDENYFMYYEETEWQTRARKAGFKTMYVPDAKLWHKVAFSSGGDGPFSIYYLVRNRFYYIKDGFSKLHWLHMFPLTFLENIFRICLYLVKGKPKTAKAVINGTIDFLKGKRGKTI